MRGWLTWLGLGVLTVLIGLLLLLADEERPAAGVEPVSAGAAPKAREVRLELDEEGAARERGVTASVERVAPNLPGLHGRVLEATTDRPVRRAIAWAATEGEIFARAFSDRDGHFTLPVFETEDGGTVTVGVTAPRGWATESEPRELEAGALGSGGELVLHVSRLLRAPLRGIVVDLADDNPVPFYRVRVRGPGAIRAYPRTDAHGRFETEGEFEAGTVHVEAQESPGFAAIEHPHLIGPNGGGDVVVRVEVGPTYQLHLLFPGDPPRRRLRAVLEPVDATGAVVEGRYLASYVDTLGDPWVRFVGEPSELGPWRLSVAAGRNAWTASVLVEARSGLYPETLRLDFRPTGDLWGTVLAADGSPVAGARVSTTGRELSGPRSTVTDADGDYWLDDLPGGRYAVSVSADDYADQQQSVEVVPGALATLDVRLARAQ
jgi:hypothetical protein